MWHSRHPHRAQANAFRATAGPAPPALFLGVLGFTQLLELCCQAVDLALLGVQLANKVTVERAGKKYIEAETTDFKPAEKLDDSLFAKP
jgi:hypothetical protein